MITQARQELILSIVEKEQAVTVTELTKRMDASESTIRRDLAALDKKGKLIKVHGGATALPRDIITKEENVSAKASMNVAVKELIAKYSVKLINNGDFIYLDAGTTTYKMIDYLPEVDAVFVTNGIAHAKKLIEKGFKTFMIGGIIKPVTEAVIGSVAVKMIKEFNFTKSFMGTNGISIREGLTTPDIEEAAFKREVVNRSYVAYVLADNTKMGVVSAISFAPLDKVCIITNGKVDKAFKDITVIKEVEE